MAYDQTKRCPRCQNMAPRLKTLKLDMCPFCSHPNEDPRYDPFTAAREDVLAATNKRRI
jgi:ribosomal protein L37AE/L43A